MSQQEPERLRQDGSQVNELTRVEGIRKAARVLVLRSSRFRNSGDSDICGAANALLKARQSRTPAFAREIGSNISVAGMGCGINLQYAVGLRGGRES